MIQFMIVVFKRILRRIYYIPIFLEIFCSFFAAIVQLSLTIFDIFL